MGINKQKIMDDYAKEQGYEDWSAILYDFQDMFNNCSPEYENNVMNWIEIHQNIVIDLIQDELKIKIANKQDLEGIQHIILNIENL